MTRQIAFVTATKLALLRLVTFTRATGAKASAPDGQCNAFHDKDGKPQPCHRHAYHRGPHHADSGLVWGGRPNRTQTRARHYTGCPERDRFRAVAGLFIPWTPAPRMAVLTAIIISATYLPIPSWLKAALGIMAGFSCIVAIIFVWATFSMYWDELEFGSKWSRTFYVISVLLVIAGVLALPAALAFLVSLVSSGQNYTAAYVYVNNGAVGRAESFLILAVLWLLIGVPNQACKINLNKDGAEEAKRVLVGLIRAAACVLTGVYLLLMHLDRGPLVKLDKSSLAAGILVTVVLMGPFYKSVATVFWQRGLVGVISYQALKQYWGNTPMEVWKASPRPADSETTEGFWELLLARLLFHKGIEMDDMFTSYSGSADSGTAPSNRHGSVTEKPRQETGTSDMQSITS